MLLVASPTVTSASYEPPVIKETIQDMADRIADEYDVSRATVRAVIQCESNWNPQAIGDHGHSRGLVQIYDDYWPEVSHQEAHDPEFSIRFLAEKLSEGRGSLWTCYRMYRGAHHAGEGAEVAPLEVVVTVAQD